MDEKEEFSLDTDNGEMQNITWDYSLEEELKCNMQNAVQPYSTEGLHCNGTWDTISCWPHSKAGSLIVLPCPALFNSVRYNTNHNASRYCNITGDWEEKSHYENCVALMDSKSHENGGVTEATTIIYYIGYSLSLAAIISALWIFFYFKDLRCMRNTFHVNLMITYLLNDLTWIVTASLQTFLPAKHVAQCSMVVLLYYFMGTNFFWMFVEGFYLYMLVVKTFTVEKIKLRTYFFLGWGAPAIIVAAWALIKTAVKRSSIAHDDEHSGNLSHSAVCLYYEKDRYQWIFIVPMIAVLLINVIFMLKIMYVLITKLRAATTVESQQYRKAAKALVVLIPLLGCTYLITIAAPNEGTIADILAYIRSILLSTQGFTVSILYCFLNGEVRNTLRHHMESWKTTRTLGRQNRASSLKDNWSPKTRTESVRLYSPVDAGPRESCVSCMTTNSTVANGNGSGSLGRANCGRNSVVTALHDKDQLLPLDHPNQSQIIEIKENQV